MTAFFLIVELFLYCFAAYIFFKKKELAIIYLPVLFFADTIIDATKFPAFIYYGIICVLILNLIRQNQFFVKNNYFAFILVIYFSLLLTRSAEITSIRRDLYNVMWFFICLPLVPAIYKKFSRDVLFKEMAISSAIILVLFILNTLLSSYYMYNPYAEYGITNGLLFGNLYATDFNVIGLAIFVLLLFGLSKRNILYLGIVVVSLAFVGLSMRRSVMGTSGIGVVICSFIYLSQNIKKIFAFVAVCAVIGLVVIYKTDFSATMAERYELRDLDNRDIQEEQRYFEYSLLYNDMFVNHRYSPWIGFGLFNSPGNYGDGKFYERSLHGDLTSIVHSSGFIGLGLYLLMIAASMIAAYRAAKTRNEKLIVIFCAIAFTSYTLTGRYTQVGNMLFIFLVAYLPIGQEIYEYEAIAVKEESQERLTQMPALTVS